MLRRLAGCASLVFIAQCSPAGQPSLSLSAKPSAIDNLGEETLLTATAVDAQGMPGKGSVKFTSVAGSLVGDSAESVTLDAEGRAQAPFSCFAALDPLCKDRVRVVAVWNGAMATSQVGAELKLAVGPQGPPPPTVAAAFDPTMPGSTTPCLESDAGLTPCQPDGGCPHGFECANRQSCILRGSASPLQVTLKFDQSHDVDLHVDEPKRDGGVCEVFWGAPARNFMGGCGLGSLDLDSNAGCTIDGVNTENVIYKPGLPTLGHYAVRVDYWKACTVVPVNWQVRVRAGMQTRYFCGTFQPNQFDTGGAGSGIKVTNFDLSMQ